MHEQLRLLVRLQDLDAMIREAQDESRRQELENLGFSLDGEEALQAARQTLLDMIDARFLNVYERLNKKYGRAVVPVENKTCLRRNGPPSGVRVE